jgi:hypothetical protein
MTIREHLKAIRDLRSGWDSAALERLETAVEHAVAALCDLDRMGMHYRDGRWWIQVPHDPVAAATPPGAPDD